MIDSQPHSEEERLSSEAAYWCARLHDAGCSPEERLAFAHWIKQHPSHESEYEAMLAIWRLADQLRATSGMTQPLSSDSTTKKHLAARPRRFVRYATAAMLGAVSIWLGGWMAGWLPSQASYYAAQQQPREVILADGSRVQLNSGSSLIFASFRDRRSAWLGSSGEGYFEVSHNAERPFSVLTDNGKVRVTGTRFNVWTAPQEMLVSLLEGSVLVSPPDGVSSSQARLSPGMQAHYRQGARQIYVNQASTSNAIAWIEGKLVLDDLPLSTAVPLINRYLKHPVQLGDAASGNLRIGGIYRTDDLQALIDSLPAVLPVELRRHADGGLEVNSRYARRE